MAEYRYLTVKDITELTGKKTSWAYNVIRKLNEELESEGYLIARGRIPAKYFYERMGLENNNL